MTKTPEDALKVIQSHPEGVLQSDLWKILDVDSRKCSRLVKKLLDDGLRKVSKHLSSRRSAARSTRRTSSQGTNSSRA